jgi:hypothetical protein
VKLFACRCGNLVHFENNRCVVCSARLAYAPEKDAMVVFDDQPPSDFAVCANGLEHDVCNWLVRRQDGDPYCRACRLNQTIPDLSQADNREAWLKIERAKRRLVYTLLSWKLPLRSKKEDAKRGLAFAFLKDPPDGPRVLTGHADGLITLNIAEADDPFRESARENLGETYRTLLGHFRHESGHYYWDQLIAPDADRLKRFRELYGDETVSYDGALKSHYGKEAREGWKDRYVSAYAAAHPWEDWAETWAHYMHLWDTMETAAALGLSVSPRVPAKGSKELKLESPAPSRLPRDFDALLAGWPALTMAINDLNRAMGLADAYPFAPAEAVRAKMRFVHDVVSTFRS